MSTVPSVGSASSGRRGTGSEALVINTAVVFGSFLVLFVGGMLLFWPDVPWGALAAVTLGTMAILPILFYPVSKTLWMALELSWHPLEPHEVDAAANAADLPPTT